MKATETKIPGLKVIEPAVFEDNRGYFFESFNYQKLEKYGIEKIFIQDNQSKSSYGVIRGLHYQLTPHAQIKLVRVLLGKILDVAVDLRKNSPTYGEAYSIELSAENKKQLYIPSGFAHGFSVLSPEAIVLYKCDNYYNKESERGIIYNDPKLKIDWKIDEKDAIISEKDKVLPIFEDAEKDFFFREE